MSANITQQGQIFKLKEVDIKQTQVASGNVRSFSKNSRRCLMGIGLTLLAVGQQEDAQATSWKNLPAKFLKERQQANKEKLLAPIRASQQRVQAVQNILSKSDINQSTIREALISLRKASLNCYIYEPLEDEGLAAKSSLLQAQSGQNVCTLKAIVKNTALMLPTQNNQALYDNVYAELDMVTRTFSLADDSLLAALDGGDSTGVSKAQSYLDTLQTSLLNLEEFVSETIDFNPYD